MSEFIQLGIRYKEGPLNQVADGLSCRYLNGEMKEDKTESIKLDLNYLCEKPNVQTARSRLRIMCLCNESSVTSTLLDEIKRA